MVDERGFFARVFCSTEMAAAGLEAQFPQSSVSRNSRAGTLRGMHYQDPPHAEIKLVRCTSGKIYDVALDIRPSSSSFGRWFSIELSAENGLSLYIPQGFAHGFLTLEANTEVHYQITPSFVPGLGKGVRWNDPRFAIEWPVADPIMSGRDASYPDFNG